MINTCQISNPDHNALRAYFRPPCEIKLLPSTKDSSCIVCSDEQSWEQQIFWANIFEQITRVKSPEKNLKAQVLHKLQAADSKAKEIYQKLLTPGAKETIDAIHVGRAEAASPPWSFYNDCCTLLQEFAAQERKLQFAPVYHDGSDPRYGMMNNGVLKELQITVDNSSYLPASGGRSNLMLK